MKCPDCGHQNRPEARFCKQCGQSLQARAEPSEPARAAGAVCPACGATARPGARFCLRCGKPLPAGPAPLASTHPAMESLSRPHAPPPSPPSAEPTAPGRRLPRCLGWAGGIAALICIVALVAVWVVLRPKIIGTGGEPAATPTPIGTSTGEAPPARPGATRAPTVVSPVEPPLAESPLATSTPAAAPSPGFDARVGISASAVALQAGDLLTVAVTVTNTGRVAFGSLRYQLLGEWEPYLGMTTGAVVEHELDVASGQSDTATFVLEAAQAGVATLEANVTVKTREEPPSVKPVLSEDFVEITVIGGF